MKIATESSQYLSNDEHKEIVDILEQEEYRFKFCLLHALFLFDLFHSHCSAWY